MTQAELASYRQKLVALRQRLSGDVTSLAEEALNADEQASANLSHVPLHPADLGNQNAASRQVLRGCQAWGRFSFMLAERTRCRR